MKQDEGQFFTPIQICEFIVHSLPLKMLFDNGIPKVIDYACGAGHFLNTYANIAKSISNDSEAINSNIYGIEKEYRLSKVAKVSAAMYGQSGVKISYADALDESKFKERDFDLLIANPPYSVKGFLQTLSKNECEKYELFNYINLESSNAIECFFIERANRLLKSNSKVAIILPSSILNKDGVYEKTREIILRNFDIISITEFGSNTFGATGTNTVILFLSKKQTYVNGFNSQSYENLKENIESSLDFSNLYLLEGLLAYCEFMGYKKDEFREFLSGGYGEIYSHDIFKEYLNEFKNSSALSNLKKSKRYKDSNEKEALEQKEFLNFCLNLEKEKILFFSLVKYTNTLIIKSPSENKAQSKFLGYEWSNRKGSEGLKELQTPYFSPLFERENLDNPEKLCFLVRRAFILNDDFEKQKLKDPYVSFSQNLQIPANLSEFAFTTPLLKCLDFTSAKFNKAINLNIASSKNGVNLNPFEGSKFKLVKLGEICEILTGSTPSTQKKEFYGSDFPFYRPADLINGRNVNSSEVMVSKLGYESQRALPKKSILVSCIGTIGRVGMIEKSGIFNQQINALLPNNNYISEFLFYLFDTNFFKQLLIQQTHNTTVPIINKSKFSNIKIPLPPLEAQEKIVKECEEVEEKFKTIRMSIEEYKSLIKEILIKSCVITDASLEIGGGMSKI